MNGVFRISSLIPAGLLLAGCGGGGRGESIELRMLEAFCEARESPDCTARPTALGVCGARGLSDLARARARAVNRGNVVVDEAAIEECVEAIVACSFASSRCEWAFAGQVHEGGACEVSDACGPGLVCTGGPSACGACVPGTQFGDSCTTNSQCLRVTPGATAACDPTGVCIETVDAVERSSVGESCGRLELAPNRYATTRCAVGLVCGASSVCEPFSAPEGTECLGDAACDPNLACTDGHCAATVTADLGQGCDDPSVAVDPFRVCDGSRGAICLFGSCALLPGEVGAGCSVASGCANGLVCLRELCSAPGRNGSACNSGSDCESGACIADVCSPPCL